MTDRKKADEPTYAAAHDAVGGLPDEMMSAREFAHLGGGEISYIRELTKSEAGKLFPEVRDLDDFPQGVPLFALHAADGSPLALADSKCAAEAQAAEDDLLMVPVH